MSALLVGLATERGHAACTPDPPSDDDAVVCSGTDSTGFDASGATRLTITTSGTTTLDESGALDSAILISDDNTVTIGADATVNVTETDGFGIRGGDRNTITNDGTIVVDGANGVAIDVQDDVDADPPNADPGILNNGSILLNGDGAVGLRSNDNVNLLNGSTGTITVTGAGGTAMQGRDDNFLQNDGTITIDGDDGRGLVVRNNTGVPLPNGAVANGTIIVNGARGIAVEVGDNVGAVTAGGTNGLIDLNGDESIGLSAGNRTDPDAQANFTNSGVMNVDGADAFGLKVGDGWVSGGTTPTGADTRNTGTINVTGQGSFGIFAGDEGNTTGNHNSFVLNTGTINVGPLDQDDNPTGTDAIGISLGGNDLLDAADPNVDGVYSFQNRGTVRGGPDAGALIEFRNAVDGFENRLLNRGLISADLTNQGTTNRAIAIQGSSGVEVIENVGFGEIEGDILLGGGNDLLVNTGVITGVIDFGEGDDSLTNDFMLEQDVLFGAGDDRYEHGQGGQIADTATLDGGVGGNDVAVLGVTGNGGQFFDLERLANFERLQIAGPGGGIGWQLENGAGFTSPVEVLGGGVLTTVAGPVALGGDLIVNAGGAINALVDEDAALSGPGAVAPVSVAGDATLDGTIVVRTTADVTEPGSYVVLDVDGTTTGSFADVDLPAPSGLVSYSSSFVGDDFVLTLTRGSFASVARGQNRTNIASYLDAVVADGNGDPALNDALAALAASTGDLNVAYDWLSPEAYDAQAAVVIENGRRIARTLFNRPRECRTDEVDPWQGVNDPLRCNERRWAPWASVVGGFRKRDGFSGHPRYDSTMGGLIAGIEGRPLEGLDLNFAVSTQDGSVNVALAGESDIRTVEVSGHAAYSIGPLRVQTVAGWAYGRHQTRRNIRISAEGAVPAFLTAEDNHDSSRILVAAEAGVLLPAGPIRVEPLVGLDWTFLDQATVKETQAGVLNEIIDRRKDDIGTVTGGVRISTVYDHTRYLHTALEWMNGVWRPSLDLRWRQTLTGNERTIEARFASASSQVPEFEIDAKEDSGGLEIGAGFSFVPRDANRLQIDFRYQAYRASHTVDHDLVAKILIGF